MNTKKKVIEVTLNSGDGANIKTSKANLAMNGLHKEESKQ